MQLTRSRIIRTAMQLIERDGPEGLSMYELATELGCGVIALYSQFPSKSALLDAVAATLLSQVEVELPAAASWQDQLRAQARAFRQAVHAHPTCAVLALGRPLVSAAPLRPVERALAALRAAGFSRLDCAGLVVAIASYALAAGLQEAARATAARDGEPPGADRPRLRLTTTQFPQLTDLAVEPSLADREVAFEAGLDVLLLAAAALRLAPAA
jgi:AcrR family transcriptional regulator